LLIGVRKGHLSSYLSGSPLGSLRLCVAVLKLH